MTIARGEWSSLRDVATERGDRERTTYSLPTTVCLCAHHLLFAPWASLLCSLLHVALQLVPRDFVARWLREAGRRAGLGRAGLAVLPYVTRRTSEDRHRKKEARASQTCHSIRLFALDNAF